MHAHAKINLCLHVGDRRSDGYHELASLVGFTEAGDDLSAEPADTLELTVTGPFAAACPRGDDNLVLRAAKVLREASGVSSGARLRLIKSLPVASGIGGGSADAAATFKILNALWRTRVSEDDLARLGLSLGADLPVCLRDKTSIVRGMGEVIEPAPSALSVPIVLVNPGVPIATAERFRSLTIRSGATLPDPPEGFADAIALSTWLSQTRNDLELPARVFAPVIGETVSFLAAAKGCLLSRMSGSGATCFGLFATETLAAQAAALISAQHPSWWVVPTQLRP